MLKFILASLLLVACDPVVIQGDVLKRPIEYTCYKDGKITYRETITREWTLTIKATGTVDTFANWDRCEIVRK